MSEGSLFFDGQGRVQKSLVRIIRKFDELGIEYAVADGMALFAHGHRRFTENIDILVTRETLERVHEELDGRGWVRPFSKGKNLRDADTGVRVEFLLSGDYPGDGKPKPVQFPDPHDAAVEIDGVKYVNLAMFIDLKLASGMTGGAHRAKDLVDVGELIKSLNLPESLADSLNPFVREAFLDLWRQLNATQRRYVMAQADAANRLQDMLADGVTVAPPAASDKGPILETYNPAIAKKYGMTDATDFFDA